MGLSSSSAQASVEAIFEFFGWPAGKLLTRDQADRVKRLLWTRRRAQERVLRAASHSRPMVEITKRVVEGNRESPIEEVMVLAMNTREDLIGEFTRNHPVGPYRIDFAFPGLKLAVECDGRQYHTTPAQVERDIRRDRYLSGLGWHVKRFTGSEIHRNVMSCVDRIEVLLRWLERVNS